MAPSRTVSLAQAQSSGEFVALSDVSGIAVDLRYATSNNFLKRNIYAPMDCAWLHRDAAAALANAQQRLSRLFAGMQIVVLDALRPHSIQVELYNRLVGTGLEQYLAPPERGSIHSFGMAVDVTLLDANGKEVEMGTGFDAMTEASHPEFEAKYLARGELSPQQVAQRLLLRTAMKSSGFNGISTEWWHFDCGDKDHIRARYARVD